MVNIVLAIIFFVFTSLGFSNSLLGAAWPSMQPDFGVPVSYAGVISMIIAGGTIVASLANDRLTRRISPGKLTAICSLIAAVSLFGFFSSHSFTMLCILAVPYGLATGSFDATLNNYVAMHYKNRHMNWMHCCWGIGSALGPYLMGFSLTRFGN